MPDLVLDGYERTTPIGRGGFAAVYRAWQPAFDRDVAIKVLLGALDEEGKLRFERECVAIGGLSGHPNIVTVYEHGTTPDARAYIVMEYLAGGSLADRLDRGGPLPWTMVCDIGVKIAGALESAHRHNILHRDVKPDNVLVSRFDEVKLGDFGIAQLRGHSITVEGGASATIAYAAPEILSGDAPSVASDVYSLGCMLYALLRGLPPFVRTGDENLVAMIARIANAPASDLRPFGTPQSVCAVIEQAMSKAPGDRQPSVARLGRQLQAALAEAGFAVPPIPLESASGLSGERAAAAAEEGTAEATVGPAARVAEHPSAVPAVDGAAGTPDPADKATPAGVQTPTGSPDADRANRRLARRSRDAAEGEVRPPGAKRTPMSWVFVAAAVGLFVLTFVVAFARGNTTESVGDVPAGS